ncbi:unnamed protein product [Lactuca virosa]|uniref:Uncharacterized protein n=1 Tax=Lactuca virosa TaxID=75947 RepID=A0AAU9MJ97_9ASTR|nr:unnamed protein product [Lactuca virosa]
MNHTQQQPKTLISSWFSKEKFAETYKGNIRPLNEKDGEYRKIKSVGGTKIRENCWEEGHNKRTYKNPTKPQPTKEKKRKGRPVTRDVAMKKQQHPQVKRVKIVNTFRKWMDRQGVIVKKGKGKAKASQSVKGIDEGLQDVMMVHDLKGDEHARELLASGYSEDEVYRVLYEQHLDVEILAEVPPVLETMHEEVPEVEEGIAETPPSQRLMRTRRPSERITKIQTGMKAVGKKVVGPGRSRLDPVSLE